LLKISILIFEIASIVTLGLSLYTVVISLTGSLSENNFKVTTETLGTGDMKLKFMADPINRGFLGIDLSMELAVKNYENVTIARNSTSISIDPGSQRSFTLDLLIPASELARFNQTGVEGVFELTLGIRTLSNLVGFTNSIRIKGGIGA